LGARDLDWLDLKTEIGLSDDDIRFLQLAFHPTDEGIAKIIAWGLNDILAYYLV